MTTYIQLHTLTSYGPSNLNRDDSGRPKSVRMGGVNRLRISSQCLKRAWRKSDVFAERVGDHIGIRTRRIGPEIEQTLIDRGIDEKASKTAAKAVSGLWKKEKKGEGGDDAGVLFLFSRNEFDTAIAVAEKLARGDIEKIELSDFLTAEDQSVDVAMFGRMLANAPENSVAAACAVSHAITTHAAEAEDDYFSACEDLSDVSGAEGAGAGHVDVREFGSGVFYEHVVIDTDLLRANLGGRVNLANAAIDGLIRSATTVSPGGMRASFAHSTAAAYAAVEVGPGQPRSLAAAYTRPISNRDSNDYLQSSVSRLEQFRDKLDAVYGSKPTASASLDVTGTEARGSIDDLVTIARIAA